MALKLTIADLVEVPGTLRPEYTLGADGKYHLSLEGKHPDSERLAEFRTNNIALLKEVEELRPLKTKYEGIDPDAAREALAKAAEHAAIADEYRVLKARPDSTKLAEELAAERDAHQRTQFRSELTALCLRAGARESAIDYLVQNAEKIFAPDGSTKEFSKANPGVPLTIAEWLSEMGRTADFAFLGSRGGGAPRGHTGANQLGSYSRPNELRDPTPQQLGERAADIAAGRVRIVYSY